jgi:hypothetical protein
MDLNYLTVELSAGLELQFRLLDNPLTHLWLERMALRDQYPLDHPARFYGFDSKETEIARATEMIQQCIATINAHQVTIDRPFTNIFDQDYLNYLHNIFERYHGLLDKQDHEYWNTAPKSVQRALAELNIAVHRCETVTRSNRPRFVCTWFGLPKTHTVTSEMMHQYGTLNPPFGSVCLNYVEIGKTLEDLTMDDDKYISDDAFLPFNHYSADFAVRFYEDSPDQVAERLEKMQQYYIAHQEFFCERGYQYFPNARLLPYRFPVAHLIETQPRAQLLETIQTQQLITWVSLT